jgi:hypothetical protein
MDKMYLETILLYIDSIFLPYVIVNFGDNVDRDITSLSPFHMVITYVNKLLLLLLKCSIC